jgi:hypothetical protein
MPKLIHHFRKRKSGLVKEPARYRFGSPKLPGLFCLRLPAFIQFFPCEIAITEIIAIAKGKTVFNCK